MNVWVAAITGGVLVAIVVLIVATFAWKTAWSLGFDAGYAASDADKGTPDIYEKLASTIDQLDHTVELFTEALADD